LDQLQHGVRVWRVERPSKPVALKRADITIRIVHHPLRFRKTRKPQRDETEDPATGGGIGAEAGEKPVACRI
jgi:hypothetical protein